MTVPSRATALKVLASAASMGSQCPCHTRVPGSPDIISNTLRAFGSTGSRRTDYAFEMAASTVRFGRGVTKEVGFDLANMGAKKVAVITDPRIARLPVMQVVSDSLSAAKVPFEVFSNVSVEPTDSSFMEAITWAKARDIDAFLAVGGGSALDTAKAANLYKYNPGVSTLNDRRNFPDADFLDFVNAPIGKGKVVSHDISPLIAVPTTAGTGSETTGAAIFDYEPLKAKTGIAHRRLRPTLGIIDPANCDTMPDQIAIASGFDVLCHALESYTAIPYDMREPCPQNPAERPTYQGSNPISDVWSLAALEMMALNFKRSISGDPDARDKMVHLCHGLSYPISGLNKHLPHVNYTHPEYDQTKPLVPHGISVAITAPAVFRFTAAACPERHLAAAAALGADVRNKSATADVAGRVLGDTVLEYMADMGVPLGISRLGFRADDIDALVQGTLPQHRVTKLSPEAVTAESLQAIFEDSMSYN